MGGQPRTRLHELLRELTSGAEAGLLGGEARLGLGIEARVLNQGVHEDEQVVLDVLRLESGTMDKKIRD